MTVYDLFIKKSVYVIMASLIAFSGCAMGSTIKGSSSTKEMINFPLASGGFISAIDTNVETQQSDNGSSISSSGSSTSAKSSMWGWYSGYDTDSAKFISPNFFFGAGPNWFSESDAKIERVGRVDIGISFDIRPSNFPVVFEPGFRLLHKGVAIEAEKIAPTTTYFYSVPQTVYPKLGDIYEPFEISEEIQLVYLDVFLKAKFDIAFDSVVYFQPFVGYAASFLQKADDTFQTKYHKYEEREVYKGTELVYIGGTWYEAAIYEAETTYVEDGVWGNTYDRMSEMNSLHHSLLFGVDFLVSRYLTIGIEYDMGLSPLMKKGYTSSPRSIHPSIELETTKDLTSKDTKASSLLLYMGLRF